MTEYKPEDFKDMLFPFHRTENILESFPKLKEYQEFNCDLPEINKVIKYVGFAYDKRSPLQKIENIVQKKVTAAQLAGFENTDDEYVQNIMKCNDPTVNLMIVRYCRMQRSRLYMVIVAGNETLNDTIYQLLNYEKTNKKNVLENSETKLKLLSQAKATAIEMDELSSELLADDNSELKDFLYRVSDMSEEEYINLTPEDFSKESWIEKHPSITSNVK